jgi:hypothetical protein
MLKTVFGNNDMGRIETLGAFPYSNMWKVWLKVVNVQVPPAQVTNTKMQRKFTDSSMKSDRDHSEDHWQVTPIACNSSVNSNGGFEYMAYLHGARVLFAH